MSRALLLVLGLFLSAAGCASKRALVQLDVELRPYCGCVWSSGDRSTWARSSSGKCEATTQYGERGGYLYVNVCEPRPMTRAEFDAFWSEARP